MESPVTTETMVEQTVKQIEMLENWNKLLLETGGSIGDTCDQAAQVRSNIILIQELSKFLWSFNRKMSGSFQEEGLGESE